MTARVTTLQGAEAGTYYVEDLPSYYLDVGEPPGRWLGRSAAAAGLVGDVDPDAFVAVMAGFDPTGTWLRGRRFGEDSARGYDVTCSAPKSVSVLWAVADVPVRDQVIAAHDAAVRAVVEFVDDHALTRVGPRGAVSVVDAEGVTAAVFRQHTSRALDPQLHSHVVVSSKVQGPGGKWLALDARSIKFDQQALSAIYHAALRSELTSTLGVRWEAPVNGIAELAVVPAAVREAFSKRTAQYEARLATKLARFARNLGRQPTPRERHRLQREAAVDSRPAKPTPGRPDLLHAGWRDELASIPPAVPGTLPFTPRALVGACVDVPAAVGLDEAGVVAMVDQALAALSEQQSTWRRWELIRELARALPPTVTVPAGELGPWLDRLATAVADRELIEYAPTPPPGVQRRRDGRPVTESVLDVRYTTPAIVAQEEEIVRVVERRLAYGSRPGRVADDGLDPAQLDVARTVAGTGSLVLVVGPAGTGKTTALRPAVAALAGRGVFGVAPSATAAAVLAEETGMQADTVDKLLHDHRHREHSPLLRGTTIVVDEAGMLATAKLAELLAQAERRGWRIVLVGDPLQLSAVGRGGMFAHLTERYPTVELDHVHRFTNPWEREASLALRRGDPAALEQYDRHGRIHAATAATIDDQIVAHWNHIRKRGTVAVLAPTNAAARRLNQRLQAERRTAGELTGPGRRLPSGETIHVSDQIATRQNERSLRTDRGTTVKNRAGWTVEAVSVDGAVTVRGRDGRIELPADYAARHVALAYAETIHAAQGRTVDHAIAVVDGTTDASAVYVAATRGRSTNHFYVDVEEGQSAPGVLEGALARRSADRPAISMEHRADGLQPSDGSSFAAPGPSAGLGL